MIKLPALTAATFALTLVAGLPARATDTSAPATPAVSADNGGCQPAWPSSSLQKKDSGTVDMLILVHADGKVSDARIVRSSGYRDLDRASIAAAGRCKFVPEQADGQPVTTWFSLRNTWIPGRGTVPPSADMHSCAKPEWPKAALRSEQQGAVTLAFLIDTDGKVSDSRIEKSSGFPLLDLAAQQGIEKCSFTPGLENGAPAKSWLKMQYVWTLDARDPARAQQSLQQAREGAARGDAESTYKLALSYLYGTGVARDPAQAAAWMRQAADAGSVKAQESMGMLAIRWIGDKATAAAPANPVEAADWFGKAAAQGSAAAQCLLGQLLMQQNKFDEALPWVRQSAQQNYAPGQTMVAILLMKRNNSEDLLEAIDMLTRASAQHNSFAQAGLGHAYETGHGVSQDYAQAAALYKQAAVENNTEAQLALARLYEQGLGVPQDPIRAKELRRLATK